MTTHYAPLPTPRQVIVSLLTAAPTALTVETDPDGRAALHLVPGPHRGPDDTLTLDLTGPADDPVWHITAKGPLAHMALSLAPWTDLTVHHKRGHLNVHAPTRALCLDGIDVTAHIHAPTRALWSTIQHGRITLDAAATGTIDITADTADIALSTTGTRARVHTRTGTIHATTTGPADLRTEHGDLTARLRHRPRHRVTLAAPTGTLTTHPRPTWYRHPLTTMTSKETAK